MIYSVWNQPSRSYDYYEANDVQLGANTPSPKHISAADLGVPVDHAGWPLPASAVKVGSGDRARGRIASRPGAQRAGLGAIPMDPNTIGLVAMGVAAFLLWRSGFAKAP
jgi:hypothetical protein